MLSHSHLSLEPGACWGLSISSKWQGTLEIICGLYIYSYIPNSPFFTPPNLQDSKNHIALPVSQSILLCQKSSLIFQLQLGYLLSCLIFTLSSWVWASKDFSKIRSTTLTVSVNLCQKATKMLVEESSDDYLAS